MSLEEKIKQLEEQLKQTRQELENYEKSKINSVEDAFHKLKPSWFISRIGNILKLEPDIFENNKCNITSEKRAKQVVAFIQLHLIAEAMNQVIEKKEYFFINRDLEIGELIFYSSFINFFPIFYTKKLAEEALIKFKPLFKDLYMLA